MVVYHINIPTYTLMLRERDFMSTVLNSGSQVTLESHNGNVRNLVFAGLEHVKEGNTKDFNSVCDRLENKY